MLTTKRIITDDDRQGGYATTAVRNTASSARGDDRYGRYEDRYENRVPRSSRTEFTEYERDRLDAMRMRAPQGSRYEQPFTERVDRAERTTTVSRPAQAPAPSRRTYSEEDLMPSIRTMQSVKTGKSRQSSSAKRMDRAESPERRPLSQNAKLLIAVYAIIVFIALVLIIASGIAANRQADKNAELENSKGALQAEVTVIRNETTAYYTPNLPVDTYEPAADSEVVSFTVSPLSDKVTYEPQTNVFDKICDFFSRLFGG